MVATDGHGDRLLRRERVFKRAAAADRVRAHQVRPGDRERVTGSTRRLGDLGSALRDPVKAHIDPDLERGQLGRSAQLRRGRAGVGAARE